MNGNWVMSKRKICYFINNLVFKQNKNPFKNIFFHFIYLDKKKETTSGVNTKLGWSHYVCKVIYFGHPKLSIFWPQENHNFLINLSRAFKFGPISLLHMLKTVTVKKKWHISSYLWEQTLWREEIVKSLFGRIAHIHIYMGWCKI